MHQPGGIFQFFMVIAYLNIALTGLHKRPTAGQADICGFGIGCQIVHLDISCRAFSNNNRKLILEERPFTLVVSDFVAYFQILTSH